MRNSPGPFVQYPWQLVGGHLAVDLVNTVAWQLSSDKITDRLPDPDHLADWLAVAAPRHGVPCSVTPADVDGAAGMRILAAVRRLRAAGQAAFAAHVDRRPIPVRAVQTIRAHYCEAMATIDVAPQLPLRHEVAIETAKQILPVLGLALGELSSRPEVERLRRCADHDCGWFFLDDSRNHSRRWCDPSDCGNRNRVKAFAARARP